MTDPALLSLPPTKTIDTPRLRLRTVQVADAAAILPMITDKTTMKYTSGVVPNDLDKAEKWLSARALGDGVFNFVITLRNEASEDNNESMVDEEEQIVGIMGSYHWPEIGYLMHPGSFLFGSFFFHFFLNLPYPLLLFIIDFKTRFR